MISVIICTKNKQSQLLVCLHSLVINKFTDCEILVIDQTNISLRNQINQTKTTSGFNFKHSFIE